MGLLGPPGGPGEKKAARTGCGSGRGRTALPLAREVSAKPSSVLCLNDGGTSRVVLTQGLKGRAGQWVNSQVRLARVSRSGDLTVSQRG